ncbi:winged helix-turn-helix domain-containing protein [Pseudocitrobacter cyperus]|uniref:Winged helix-turn-helix domain-containing protein n=1 Tax=Pseudocitrobacter cyperus TaxID=3112843 RepID=A0ABV0HPH0_9ENTR
MKYRIAEKIVFDSESDWIVYRDGDSVLMEKKLTRTAAQILSILLASYGELVERDYLLSEVWETRGHHGSNSSLNQYISILRKTLYEMGIPKDCIVSEPKKGFIFSRAVMVREVLAQELLQNSDDTLEEALPPVVIQPDAAKSPSPNNFRAEHNFAVNIALWLLVVITMLAVFFEINRTRSETGNLQPVKLFNLKKCHVFSDTGKYTSYQPIMKEVIYSIHPDIDKQCSSENMILFIRVQPSIYFGHAGRVFLALCAGKSDGDELTYCENNYRYNYLHHQEQ